MIKNILILVVVASIVACLSCFVYGYNKGVEKGVETRVSLSTALKTDDLDKLVNSKVFSDMALQIHVVLKGKLIEVSVPDRTVTLEADGDLFTIYLREDASFSVILKENRKVIMEELESYKGGQVTIIATIDQMGGDGTLEGRTFFPRDINVKLRSH